MAPAVAFQLALDASAPTIAISCRLRAVAPYVSLRRISDDNFALTRVSDGRNVRLYRPPPPFRLPFVCQSMPIKSGDGVISKRSVSIKDGGQHDFSFPVIRPYTIVNVTHG